MHTRPVGGRAITRGYLAESAPFKPAMECLFKDNASPDQMYYGGMTYTDARQLPEPVNNDADRWVNNPLATLGMHCYVFMAGKSPTELASEPHGVIIPLL